MENRSNKNRSDFEHLNKFFIDKNGEKTEKKEKKFLKFIVIK